MKQPLRAPPLLLPVLVLLLSMADCDTVRSEGSAALMNSSTAGNSN
jgi:hypothetical protein